MRKSSHWWRTDVAVHPHGDFIPHEADIVIIGAGIVGVATAYWLFTHKQKSVVVLDNGPYPGYKGAGREFGMLLSNGGLSYSALVDQLGEQKARFLLLSSKRNNDLLHEFITKNEIACGYVRNGGLRLAGCVKEMDDLKQDAEILAALGVNNTILSEQQIEAIVPSNRLYGALYIPSEGMLDPFTFVNFTASRLQDTATIKFYYSAGVKEVHTPEKPNNDREVWLNNGHIIRAKKVVHANGETPQLDCLIPYREHAIASEDLPENIRETFPCMPMLVNGGDDYFRLDDPIFLCSGGRYSDQTKGEILIRDDSSYNPKIYQGLSELTTKLFPVTAMTGHSSTWTMVSYTTPDSMPVVGPLPKDNKQFVASGLGSHRFSFGFLAGRMIAELLVNKKGGIGIAAKNVSPKRFES